MKSTFLSHHFPSISALHSTVLIVVDDNDVCFVLFVFKAYISLSSISCAHSYVSWKIPLPPSLNPPLLGPHRLLNISILNSPVLWEILLDTPT